MFCVCIGFSVIKNAQLSLYICVGKRLLEKCILKLCYHYSMLNLIFADLLVFIHFGFILFVIFGGFLALKWRKLIWFHLPAAIWGVLIEFSGWICPLTHFENRLRSVSGGGYASSFIDHYLIPMMYPSALTREIQIGLGIIVILLNLLVYRKLFFKRNESQ